MSFAEKLAALLALLKDMDAWYKGNRDVAAPAVAAFRDLLGSMFSAVPVEKRMLKYKAWERFAAVAGEHAADPAMAEFQSLMSRAADTLPPLLSRIYIERRTGKDAVGKIGTDDLSGGPGSDRD
ncbi:MAG: hypothetical protein PHC52_00580 [Syntrophales bacterium]|nr:hypothetical protein [Syntrophales bacterium]